MQANVATDDGLETGLHGVRVKTHAAKEIHDVGNPERHTAVLEHLFNDRIDAHHPVNDGVLGMESQMYEGRISLHTKTGIRISAKKLSISEPSFSPANAQPIPLSL